MAPAKGNTNAEKWTEETALEAIQKVHDYNLENKNNYHLGLALIENDFYPELWSAFTNKFKENKIVSKAIKKVESYLEARIVNNTMSGDARGQAMAIFYLKNKHDYADKTEVEKTNIDITLSPEERLAKLAAFDKRREEELKKKKK